MIKYFTDKINTKTGITLRDGVLEYYGAEIGQMPDDKLFTVYRSPAQVAKVSNKLVGIPLINEHVEVGTEESAEKLGIIEESEPIDLFNDECGSVIGIKNKFKVNDAASSLLDEKREISLGYQASMRKHDKYDFEQFDIVPFHAALVTAGRCGSQCSFLDSREVKKLENEEKKQGEPTTDAEYTLEQIAEVFEKLPKVAKYLPVAKLSEVMPQLIELINAVNEMELPEEEQQQYSDAAIAKLIDAKATEIVKERLFVIEKAKRFLDASTDFLSKSTIDLMRESLATQTREKFTDAELPIAFKLLKKQADVTIRGLDESPENKINEISNKWVTPRGEQQ